MVFEDRQRTEWVWAGGRVFRRSLIEPKPSFTEARLDGDIIGIAPPRLHYIDHCGVMADDVATIVHAKLPLLRQLDVGIHFVSIDGKTDCRDDGDAFDIVSPNQWSIVQSWIRPKPAGTCVAQLKYEKYVKSSAIRSGPRGFASLQSATDSSG